MNDRIRFNAGERTAQDGSRELRTNVYRSGIQFRKWVLLKREIVSVYRKWSGSVVAAL